MGRGRHPARRRRGEALRVWSVIRLALLALLTALFAASYWHALKPLPAGTRIISVGARLGESDLEVLRAAPREPLLARQLAQVGAAEQLVVIEQSPLPRELAQALLVRKHNRPGLRAVVVTDPASATPATRRDLVELERSGVIVARVRTERLRDSNLLFAGIWRLCFGWADSAFDEAAGSLAAHARELTRRADERQLLAADDGQGSWRVQFGAADAALGLAVRGAPAHDILASQLAVAGWSIDDERLPVAPPAPQRRAGSIDARYLSEGGIGAALTDALRGAARGDELSLEAHALAQRGLIDALTTAAVRGAHVQLLLDALEYPNAAVASELQHAGIALRFRPDAVSRHALALLRHGQDLTVYYTSAPLTRRALDDYNLESGLELRLPARTDAARLLQSAFDSQFHAAPAPTGISEVPFGDYLRYRLSEALGLAVEHQEVVPT